MFREASAFEPHDSHKSIPRQASCRRIVVVGLWSGQHRCHLCRVILFEPHGAVKPIAVDAGIAITPKRTGNHQEMYQVETCGVIVRALKNMGRRMGVLPFAALRHPAVKVNGKCTNRLGENPHADSDCRQRQ